MSSILRNTFVKVGEKIACTVLALEKCAASSFSMMKDAGDVSTMTPHKCWERL